MVTTAIFKDAVAGRVKVNDLNLEGDAQADLTVHGGWSKAVYVYPGEHYEYWRNELPEMELGNSQFGENLTTEGLLDDDVSVGDRFRVGTAELVVTQPRLPCFKLGLRMSDPHFPRRFQHVGRMGAYLRILREGELGAGDEIRVVERPEHEVTMELMADARLNRGGHDERLLAAPGLPEKWRRRAASAAAPSRAAAAERRA